MDYYFIGYFIGYCVTATLLTTIFNMEKIFGGQNEFEFLEIVIASTFFTVILSSIWPLSLPVIVGFLIKKIWNKTTKR